MMILQYVKPNIFSDFIDLYGKGNLNTYLSAYEKERIKKVETKNNSNESINIDKKWNDEWFERWVNEEPNIKEENLVPYFYLSRGTNHAFNYSTSIKLSEPAKKILDAFVGENDIAISRAINEIKQISDVECNLMVDELYNAFITDSAKKKINVIRGLAEIALNKGECIGTVLDKLKLIPSNSITKSMLVHIDALKEIKEDEINTLISMWKNSNSKLK